MCLTLFEKAAISLSGNGQMVMGRKVSDLDALLAELADGAERRAGDGAVGDYDYLGVFHEVFSVGNYFVTVAVDLADDAVRLEVDVGRVVRREAPTRWW